MIVIGIIEEIAWLKKEKNAVILVHNYQPSEIQDIGDFVGDSFGLAQKAMQTPADVIVFCGVDFMAETAKILNPDKMVIHPASDAICPMAAMVDIESLGWMKEKYPDAVVVSYVNTSAEVKAESDYCCTSSNAVEIIKSLEESRIIFIPDSNLGNYVKRFIMDKDIILWPGVCPTHHKIKREHILKLKMCHPKAVVLVHPECNPDVIDIADNILSTQGMINYVANAEDNEFIIGTEKELCYRLDSLYPLKTFYPIDSAICPNMKKNTLVKILDSMKLLCPSISLSDETVQKAFIPLQRMIGFGRSD